jgi:cytochrome c oxidase cbb3-type subunit III
MMRWTALLALLAALAACSDRRAPQPAAGAPAVSQSAAARHEAGRGIYNFRCYFCHGYSGNAQTLASTYLEPRPRDFTAAAPPELSREKMLDAVANGHPGTAMRGFAGILSPAEIATVTDFVRQEFMHDKATNTRYHTPQNGWPDHARYAAAFPFAIGALPIDMPPAQLTPAQRAGSKLFMSSCVSCHDRARVRDAGAPWDARPLSYPRNGFEPGDDLGRPGAQALDAVTSATPYHLHDRAPELSGLSRAERRGESLFQKNCAFCHAADGTARNWIGSFLEPHPRDLTAPGNMRHMTRERLANVIREGLPSTSMPAWKSVLSEDDIAGLVAYIGRAFHPLAPSAPRAAPAP